MAASDSREAGTARDSTDRGRAASDSREQGRAILKGIFQKQPVKADWPSDPEEACIKHSAFLKLWCPMGFSKPQSRAAWKGAFPRLADGDMKWGGRVHRNEILNITHFTFSCAFTGNVF